MKNIEQKKVDSLCDDCDKLATFAFNGCTINCDKFKKHILDVLKIKCSPCKDLRCKIPGANKNKIGICIQCRLPQIYADRQGTTGVKCVLGVNPPTQYVTKWDIDHGYRPID